MSKHTFKSILKKSLPDVTVIQLDRYWDLALTAQLPARVFDVIAADLYRLPDVYGAYEQKLGHSPVMVKKDQARRLILEMLIEGPRYMVEIQKLFSIPTALRRQVLTQLINDGLVCFAFCPIGNCIAYSLSPCIRLTRKLKQRIEEVVTGYQTMSLYQVSMYMQDCKYSDLCAYARTIFQDESHKLEVSFTNGKTYIAVKGELRA